MAGAADTFLHSRGPVCTRHEVPFLEQHPIAGLLQLPRDPLGPGHVRSGIGNEKMP